MDRLYRVAHHGEALLAPELGVLNAKVISAGEVLQDGDLKITAYTAEHPPIHPAVGYRIDYRGRSVVVSGDSNVGTNTVEIVDGADLLLHDALSLPMVTALASSLEANGRSRQSKIVTDVIDYHASTTSLIGLNDNRISAWSPTIISCPCRPTVSPRASLCETRPVISRSPEI